MNLKRIFYLVLIICMTPLLAQDAQPGGTGGQGAAQPNGTQQPSVQVGNEALYLDTLTSPLGDTKILKITQRGEIRAVDDEDARPPEGEAYSISQNADQPNHILGVKTYFGDRGFDRVELAPPHEYVIKGKARQFSVWVLGRKFRHTMYIKLRDYRGRTHKLRMGRLDFFGWRKLTVTVPGWLPQSTRYSMLDKNLHFVSLFVESDVHEVGGSFYFYVDGLKALIDRSEQQYPGSEIRDNW